MSEALKEFAKQYGPFAFGIFSLLIIWSIIITPVLRQNTVDFQAHRDLVEQMNKTINNHQAVVIEQGRISGSLKEAAVIMERVISREREERIQSVESAAP